ncbi:hypothetical protein [Kitasatospora sp. NPDC088346]|uniref:hypothetical protein n=1 Tax=Kitasatospora sp. NPDC088346 TaxID=3364073 RepID=UPI0038015F75
MKRGSGWDGYKVHLSETCDDPGADQVLPALTAAMVLLKRLDQAEAENFRSTVLVALDAATRGLKGDPGPVLADITRKITSALDAA